MALLTPLSETLLLTDKSGVCSSVLRHRAMQNAPNSIGVIPVALAHSEAAGFATNVRPVVEKSNKQAGTLVQCAGRNKEP